MNAAGISLRDCEGVAYVPSTNTVFISGEGDQQILEYSIDGVPTGRKLNVPAIFAAGNIVHNYGFEALTYSDVTHRFWTTTESMLPIDGKAAGPLNPKSQNLLRLQAFLKSATCGAICLPHGLRTSGRLWRNLRLRCARTSGHARWPFARTRTRGQHHQGRTEQPVSLQTLRSEPEPGFPN